MTIVERTFGLAAALGAIANYGHWGCFDFA